MELRSTLQNKKVSNW